MIQSDLLVPDDAELLRLIRQNKRLRRLQYCYLTGMTVLFLVLGLGPMAPRSGGAAQDPKPPFPPAGEVPEFAPEPVGSKIVTQFITAECLALRDSRGKNIISMESLGGVSTLCLHGKDQKPRLELTVDKQGESRVIFYDPDGKNPVELSIDRTGAPAVSVKKYSPPKADPSEPVVPLSAK